MAYVTSSSGLVYVDDAAVTARKGLFARLLERLVAARMAQAERYVERFLDTLPAEERRRIEARLDAVAPRAGD